MLLRRWNWKSAIFSSLIRAAIFFFANLTAGWRAATGAMVAEFLYRGISAGFYGALTQAFREVEPEWAAAIAVSLLLPISSHTIELIVHFLRHTPNLVASISASACCTVISTSFNQYAMRRGALVVGMGARSVAADMKQVPALIAGFVISGPVALYRGTSRLLTPLPVQEVVASECDA
jgi:hypothetical protein